MKQGTRTGCDYCPYHAVCGFDRKTAGFGYRKLKALKPEEIWKEIIPKEEEAEDGDEEPENREEGRDKEPEAWEGVNGKSAGEEAGGKSVRKSANDKSAEEGANGKSAKERANSKSAGEYGKGDGKWQ